MKVYKITAFVSDPSGYDIEELKRHIESKIDPYFARVFQEDGDEFDIPNEEWEASPLNRSDATEREIQLYFNYQILMTIPH